MNQASWKAEMNPAYSVIFFTVASGAGYGLLALLGLVANAHGRASTMAFGFTGLILALALITAGLLSSTAHLGRPERAWRAFSQWRSSWLSREGVAAIVTYPVALAFGAVWTGLVDAPGWIAPLGLATAALCAATVFCTGMIYRQLKTIPAWHNRFTVPVYLGFGLATGSGLLCAISFCFGIFQTGAGKFMGLLTIALILMVALLKWFYWRWLNAAPLPYTMGQATGLGAGVRQWEVPHTATNFIMKEMGYQVARRHGQRLQMLTLLCLLAAALGILAALAFAPLVLPATGFLLVAAWCERWLYFAQAEHVVGLFYGKGAP
jgi:sulfite dehydrogenase (quinone) subunit SoeC